ncbi:MAG: oxidoreductase [Nitrincola lacisaponensis]|uniref:oxidoreductase n=1 Tax=Nitrincola lacisaponensis TaxID=267850 RepID=UPI00391BF0FF
MLLEGKVILVVGAAGLLGREIVNSVINEGGKVVAADINVESLASLKDVFLLNSLEITEIDITKKESVIAAIDFCIKTFSRIDGAVNASYPRNKNYGKHFFDVSFDSFSENLSLHLGGAFLLTQQCAAYFNSNRNSFSLVNISSIYGVISPKFEVYNNTKMTMPVEYAAIKSAILHLNKYVVSYIKDSRFRVNSVSPGGIFDHQPESFLKAYKDRTHGAGMLDVKEVAGSVLFLLSEQSRYITGQNIIIDDGFSL